MTETDEKPAERQSPSNGGLGINNEMLELLKRAAKSYVNTAQMLNVLEQEWVHQNCWSEWDQQIIVEYRSVHGDIIRLIGNMPN